MSRDGWFVVFLALVLVAPGCGEDPVGPNADAGGDAGLGTMNDAATAPPEAGISDAGASDAGLDGGSQADAGPPDAGLDAAFPPGTLTVTATVLELGATGVGSPQADVEACVIQPAGGPCVSTNVAGSFTASMIPSDTELLISFRKMGFFPALATFTSGTESATFEYLIVRRSTVDLLAAVVGTSVDPSAGHLFVQLAGGVAAAGATVQLVPMSGEGPFYTSDGLPEMGRTTTSEDGTTILANVSPGDYTVLVRPAAGRTCVPSGMSWTGAEPGTVRVPIRSDHITTTLLICR